MLHGVLPSAWRECQAARPGCQLCIAVTISRAVHAVVMLLPGADPVEHAMLVVQDP